MNESRFIHHNNFQEKENNSVLKAVFVKALVLYHPQYEMRYCCVAEVNMGQNKAQQNTLNHFNI